jgi:hypothetical protein
MLTRPDWGARTAGVQILIGSSFSAAHENNYLFFI